MLDNESEELCQSSPNCRMWSASGFWEFLHRCERGFIKGLENCVVDNLLRVIWVPLRLLKSAARRAQAEGRVGHPIASDVNTYTSSSWTTCVERLFLSRQRQMVDWSILPWLTFTVMAGFSRKETNSARLPKQMRKFRLSERYFYCMALKAYDSLRRAANSGADAKASSDTLSSCCHVVVISARHIGRCLLFLLHWVGDKTLSRITKERDESIVLLENWAPQWRHCQYREIFPATCLSDRHFRE
jgi:hypothetical protein